MQKRLLKSLIVLFMVVGLLFTVSCAKKEIVVDDTQPIPIEEPPIQTQIDNEKAKQEELERQRALEEERLVNEMLREKELREENERFTKLELRNNFMNEDIYFEFDRSIILQAAQVILQNKSLWMRNNPSVSVIIEGHCDERGTSEYNIALGDRRAESAKKFMINLGIAEQRLSTISYGEERPLDAANNENAWSKNRRAHFVIK